MPITDLLERNSKLYGDETALVEINPEVREEQRVTWKEYELIQPTGDAPYRREITWSVFDEKANRTANMLLGRGIRRGQKVAVLLMNCLEWLPIYFGILKTGAIAVPLNFRYTSEEIDYCLKLADADVLFFGPEFTTRMEPIVPKISRQMLLFFVGEHCPAFAEDYLRATANCSSRAPKVLVDDEDEAAIYYSSGTTGFPKAILLKHSALMQSARMEAIHHETTHDDVFLCIPPLYHTGAKMHWFGSLFTGSRAVLLKGNSPSAVLQAASQERCTIVWLLVPWAQDILTALDRGELRLEDFSLSQWRLMHIGAQPVPPSLIKHWLTYFSPHKDHTNYGPFRAPRPKRRGGGFADAPRGGPPYDGQCHKGGHHCGHPGDGQPKKEEQNEGHHRHRPHRPQGGRQQGVTPPESSGKGTQGHAQKAAQQEAAHDPPQACSRRTPEIRTLHQFPEGEGYPAGAGQQKLPPNKGGSQGPHRQPESEGQDPPAPSLSHQSASQSR